MTMILVPTPTDMLHRVNEVLESIVFPDLGDPTARSALTTARHILRFVAQRVEDEGQILFDEGTKLRGLLGEALGFLDARPAGAGLAAAIRVSLADVRDPAVYPSLTLLAKEIAPLRKHVTDLLLFIRGEGDAVGGPLHEELRAYIGWQIEQEGKIFELGYRGHGPRR